MRIISQYKDFDIPYEKIGVKTYKTAKLFEIIAYPIDVDDDIVFILGRYGSFERCKQILDDIRRHYSHLKESEFLGMTECHFVNPYFEMPQD